MVGAGFSLFKWECINKQGEEAKMIHLVVD